MRRYLKGARLVLGVCEALLDRVLINFNIIVHLLVDVRLRDITGGEEALSRVELVTS